MTIVVNLEKRVYSIGESLDHADVTDTTDGRDNLLGDSGENSKPDTITYGEDLTLQISPDTDEGYTYPDSVTVTIGGQKYEDITATNNPGGISYDPTTGIITIPATKTENDKEVPVVVGPVEISADAKLRSYGVSAVLNNLTASFGGVTTVNGSHSVEHKKPANNAEAVSVTLGETTGYDLPASVSVTIGGSSYTGFTYKEGVVSIPKDAITGAIEVTASGVKEQYNVSFSFNPADSKGTAMVGSTDVTEGHEKGTSFDTEYKATVSVKRGWKIDSISVSRNGNALTLSDDFSYTTETGKDTLTSIITVKADNQRIGNLTVKVNASKRVYTITESVDDPNAEGDNVSVKLGNDTIPGTGSNVTDGTDISLKLDPETGFELPDSITVTVKDPDNGNVEKTITVNKGETKDGVEYKNDGTVNINGTVITGPVVITGEALEKYDVEVNVVPVIVNGQPDYVRPADHSDVIVSGQTGTNVAVEGRRHELTISAGAGYSIVSFTVKNGSSEVTVPVKSGEAAPTGYSYTDNKLSIVSVSGDIEVTVNTERRRYDVTYVLGDNADTTENEASLEVSAGYEKENNLPIHNVAFVTKIKGIDDTITLPAAITVRIGTTDYSVTQGQVDSENGISYAADGTINIPAALVNADVTIIADGVESFNAEYAVELTASETFVAGKNSFELNLVDSNQNVSLARLQKKSFTVTKVTTPTGISLVDKDAVETVKATAGSNYANANFAITADAIDLFDVESGSAQWFAFAENSTEAKLNLTVHNANAITEVSDAGVIKVELESNTGDKITLNITIKRVPSQINVSVPLVLVMKTNIDGGSVENIQGYGITNNSSMTVKLQSAAVKDVE
ncbi:MAG: hypothetical protein IJ364_06645, partial [Oscillospiraceae bacterium]|nr:hypothetical protein [Oscillospiraceae bacterium]